MDRLALVIGNSNYSYAPKLNNPLNDANDIESVLQKLNFKVNKILDAGLLEIQKAVTCFLQELDEYAVGLLFYAGHGMQIEGNNYIVPTDYSSCDKGKAKVSCYSLKTFLDGVSSYKGKTIICILDACRDNPFSTVRGFKSGFAPLSNSPKGTIIAFSTSEDCGAYDGQCSNGLYTQVLKDELLIPNLKIEEMFKSVRNKVSDISINQYGSEQISWEYSSLVGDFYFSVIPQSVNLNISDDEIYDYINNRSAFYEDTCDDVLDIECLPYVDAYNKYHIPIIRLLRAYSRIYYKKKGYNCSDAAIDQYNVDYLLSKGFTKKYQRWYYKDQYVEMGDLLPLPDEMKPKAPIEGNGIEIKVELKTEYSNGKIKFILYSNIPAGIPLMFTLKGNKKYTAQCTVYTNDNNTFSEWFSDKGNPIKEGFYLLNVTCPCERVLPKELRTVFGERSRNIFGKYVKFDPLFGNTIKISYGFLVKDNELKLLDLYQSI